MLVVGLGYRKRSGKDTLASMLRKHVKHSAVISFAEALKLEVADVCQVKVSDIELNKDIFRPMLQWWGTQYRRDYQKQANYWVDRLDDKVTFMRSIGGRAAFICDVRFPNEIEYIKKNNGLLIKVDRPGLPPGDFHASENALNDFNGWDIVVNNDSTLEALNQVAKDLAEQLNRRLL